MTDLSHLSLDQRALLEEQLLNGPGALETSQPVEDASPKPLSFAQESLWFFGQLVPNSPLYNLPQAFHLRGRLDLDALEQACAALVVRHHALRTRFFMTDAGPRQMVQDKVFRLDRVDLRRLPRHQQEEEVQRLLGAEARRPFNLTEDLMIRVCVVSLGQEDTAGLGASTAPAGRASGAPTKEEAQARIEKSAVEEQHVLAVTLHHIVSDFVSLEILYRELGLLYEQVLNGQSASLPQLRISYPQLAAQLRALADSPDAARHLAYWKEQLAGALPVLELPTDRPRGGARTFSGARRRVHLSQELKQSLAELARKEGVTLYMLLLAAFQTLLFRYSGQEDIIVGTPAVQRSYPGAEALIGFLLNTLILRADLSGNLGFRELLRRTQAVAVAAFSHQELPLEKLIEELKLSRQAGVNPLCQVVFQYLASPWPCPTLPGLIAEPLSLETGTAKFDLTLTLMEDSHGLGGELEYNSDLFDAETVDRGIGHLEVLLQGIVANPNERIGQLPLLKPKEREQVLVAWNQTTTAYPRTASIHELFEAQVARRPDAIALTVGERSVSYSELNRQANRLAHFLVKTGVVPGDRVGLCLERSSDMIVSLLAILKAGAAYVPLDPTYPAEQLAYMLEDSKLALLLTSSPVADRSRLHEKAALPVKAHSAYPPSREGGYTARAGSAAETHRVYLDRETALEREPEDNLPNRVGPEDLAYVMYTSGSTGQPKGAAVPHRAVVRLVKHTNYARFDSEEVFLQFAPLSFDASTFEIWGPLLNGARLVVYPPEFQSLEQFAEVLQTYGVTTLWLTAGLFHQLVDQHLTALRGVRQLLAGGDVLSVPHVLKLLRDLPDCQLINGYGPTENTTFTCCYSFPKDWNGPSAPIGRPIGNTQVYILDRFHSPVPIGVTGELCIAGDGLARGYWNSPELTAQKFGPNPFSNVPEARLYHTGDQARYRVDGTIEFLGRHDDQVKINGFRLHLGKVEEVIQTLPGVSRAAAVARGGEAGAKQLIAYVVPNRGGPAISPDQLHRAASEKLPRHMVPTLFVLEATLPLTPNGKVDRRSLAARPPAPVRLDPAQPAPQPRDPVEEQIARIWREVFGLETVGLDDNFFDLGGHSLLATRVLSRLNQAFASGLSVTTLFDHPTVRGLAEKVKVAGPSQASDKILKRTELPPDLLNRIDELSEAEIDALLKNTGL